MIDIGAVILAGGLSRRMGENKVLLPFGPGRLIDHVIERLKIQCADVAINTNTVFADLAGLPQFADDIDGFAGPLAGVAAGLRHLKIHRPGASHLLTVAADTPFFPGDLALRLRDAVAGRDGIAVASGEDGAWHPAFALWPVGLEDDLRRWLFDPENRRVRAFVARHRHSAVPFPLIPAATGFIDPFFNINTPGDYRRALSLLDDMA
nr:molybdenum cofactor guanylyltransferase MobA [uncultured Gellertiella sp.]